MIDLSAPTAYAAAVMAWEILRETLRGGGEAGHVGVKPMDGTDGPPVEVFDMLKERR